MVRPWWAQEIPSLKHFIGAGRIGAFFGQIGPFYPGGGKHSFHSGGLIRFNAPVVYGFGVNALTKKDWEKTKNFKYYYQFLCPILFRIPFIQG